MEGFENITNNNFDSIHLSVNDSSAYSEMKNSITFLFPVLISTALVIPARLALLMAF
jgi:hypothetical protein